MRQITYPVYSHLRVKNLRGHSKKSKLPLCISTDSFFQQQREKSKQYRVPSKIVCRQGQSQISRTAFKVKLLHQCYSNKFEVKIYFW